MKQMKHRLTELGLLLIAAMAIVPIVSLDTRASALPWYYGGDDGNTIYVAVGESIQDAIDAAGDGWTVELAPGEFPLVGPYGLSIYGKSITLLGATADGYGEPASRILFSYGASTEVAYSAHSTFRNLDLISSFGSYGGSGSYGGPTLQLRGGAPVLENCVITNLNAGNSGLTSAVFFTTGNLYGELTMIDTLIQVDDLIGLRINNIYGGALLDTCLISGTGYGSGFGYGYGYAISAYGMPVTLLNTIVCGKNNGYGAQIEGIVIDLGGNCEALDCADCNPNPCPADLNRDTVVNGQDLSILLGEWGCLGVECIADITEDGLVDGTDLAVVLSTWGLCN